MVRVCIAFALCDVRKCRQMLLTTATATATATTEPGRKLPSSELTGYLSSSPPPCTCSFQISCCQIFDFCGIFPYRSCSISSSSQPSRKQKSVLEPPSPCTNEPQSDRRSSKANKKNQMCKGESIACVKTLVSSRKVHPSICAKRVWA